MSARILVLEDDEDLREELAEALSDAGFEVASAGSGLQAVAQARERAFDLVVTDVRMGGMDGLEALAQMKNHQPDLVSLVVSGYSSEEETLRALRLGAGEFLKKPFALDAFLESVQRLLARRSQESQAQERQDDLRRVALWALDALARNLYDPALISGPAHLAGRLAQQLGMDGSAHDQARLTTLLVGLARQSDAEGRLRLDELPLAQRQTLTRVLDREDELELPERVAVTVLDGGEPSEPALKEALDRARQAPVQTRERHAEQGRQARGLLALARTLADSGQVESALEAYREVLGLGDTREGVEAHLGQARLAIVGGQRSQAESQVTAAREMARRLGSLTAAGASLAGGLLQLRARLRGAQESLEEAYRLHRSLGLWSGAARARLAAACLREEAWSSAWESSLQVLLSPENLPDLGDSAPWLVAGLLRSCAEELPPLAEQALARMVRESPQSVVSAAANLTGAGRRRALVMLVQSPSGRKFAREFLNDADAEVRVAATGAVGGEGKETVLLRLRSFGGFEVYLGDERIADGSWKSQKVRYLLAWLACQSRPLSEDVVIEEFWPETTLEKARQNVYSATSSLRKQLRCEGVDPILRTPEGLQLNPDLGRWHDFDLVSDLLAQYQREKAAGRLEACADPLRRALQLYQGPFLEGCYMDWALKVRDRLEQEMMEAALHLAALAEERSQHAEALEYANRALDIDACCQHAHRVVMLAHIGLARPELALRHYEACCSILRKELGVEPGIPIFEAYQRARLAM